MERQNIILVATDGSPAALAAVEAGLELAAATNASVKFVHAAAPLLDELAEQYLPNGPSREVILANDRVLSEAASRACQLGVTADVELLGRGRGADLSAILAGIASGIGASMIVVGSRGLDAFTGALLGSVSQNLAKYATVPVVVVGPVAARSDLAIAA